MPSPKAGTLEFDPISKASVEFENPVSWGQLDPSAQEEWDDKDDGLENIENKITAEGSIGSILTPPTAV